VNTEWIWLGWPDGLRSIVAATMGGWDGYQKWTETSAVYCCILPYEVYCSTFDDLFD